MTTVRYIVPGVPGIYQDTAFTPHFNRLAASGAQPYKATVSGQPGTRAVPAPTADTVPSPDLGDIAQMGTARSTDAPPFWCPNQYYDATLNGGGTMGPVTPARIYSDNLLPVPARDPRGIPSLQAKPAVQRGQRQLQTLPNLTTWRTYGTSSYG